jgi:nucleoporin POM34
MSSTSLLVQSNNNSNTLARSTSNTSQSQLFGQSQSQSPASKLKNAAVSALTPQKGASTPSGAHNASPAASTPGRWQHPRMDEIVRRQNSSCFNPGDSRIVILNAAAILAIFIAQPYLSAYVPDESSHPHLQTHSKLTPRHSIPIQAIRNTPYTAYILHAIQLLLLINMAITLAPVFRRPDACEDIPLTPQQRHALGLPPMSRPATPQEEAQYITPPRYSRSATPRSSFGSAGSFADSMRVQARASPLSGRGSPNLNSSSIGSPFGSAARRASGSGSPYSASPLKDKVFNTSELGRRGSLGSSRGSPMGGDFDLMNSPGAKSGRASVGLNSKWLYQKGRNNPGLIGNSWGTGSVFN